MSRKRDYRPTQMKDKNNIIKELTNKLETTRTTAHIIDNYKEKGLR